MATNLKSSFLHLTKKQVAIISAVTLALVIYLAASLLFDRSPAYPSDTSADAGFARDMITHHNQAVEMSFIVRDNTTDKAVRDIAFDIINTQAVQSGMMNGWLQLWGLPQTTTRPAMEWTDVSKDNVDSHSHSEQDSHHGNMPGMATSEQITMLGSLQDKSAEVFYLQLMIEHHKGGLEMASAALTLAKDDNIRGLAQSIYNAQQAEIETMQKMLQDRGA